MKKQLLYTILLMMMSITTMFAQTSLYVTAKKGLIVRDSPSIKGERIGKFPYGSKLEVIAITDEILTLTDNGKEITGNWIRVSEISYPYSIDNKGLDCYVFNGYLSTQKIVIPVFRSSKEYKVTKVDTALVNKEDYSTTVYLQNDKDQKIKNFKVSMDGYDEKYTVVEEINNPNLKNIRKIIKTTIEHCGCYCNDDVYYWLVTDQNKWIALPILELYDLDIGNSYQEYFFNTSKNTIDLVEYKEQYKDESIDAYGFPNIKRVYIKHIKTIYWDGTTIKG